MSLEEAICRAPDITDPLIRLLLTEAVIIDNNVT
jgi:hypothetical protein